MIVISALPPMATVLTHIRDI